MRIEIVYTLDGYIMIYVNDVFISKEKCIEGRIKIDERNKLILKDIVISLINNFQRS